MQGMKKRITDGFRPFKRGTKTNGLYIHAYDETSISLASDLQKRADILCDHYTHTHSDHT